MRPRASCRASRSSILHSSATTAPMTTLTATHAPRRPSPARPARGPGAPRERGFPAAGTRHPPNPGEARLRERPAPAVGFDVGVKLDPPAPPCTTAASPTASRDVPVGPFEVALRSGYYE